MSVQNICCRLDAGETRTLSSFDSLSINLLSHVCCGIWIARSRSLAAMAAAGNEVKWSVFGPQDKLELKGALPLVFSVSFIINIT